MSLEAAESSLPVRVPLSVQLAAWLAGIGACVAGMINLIAEWSVDQATSQFLLLVIAPVVWMIHGRAIPVDATSQQESSLKAWVLAVLVSLTSLATCAAVGSTMQGFPPAYHDEYSYLFQARTLLKGSFSLPGHPGYPELFDQMHVLNEGRMASRYYPGTGLWLAPFVALGHPDWGQWLATSVAAFFVFWTGYELGRLRVAVVSGFAFALSPGIALFGNLLLAHQPTLLGLCLFLWAMTRWQRTHMPQDAFWAGCGLSFAMLCRPATAAGFGLPFGLSLLFWLLKSRRQRADHTGGIRWHIVAMGLPLVVGWGLMLAYNKSVTGSLTTSPYQLYTDIYTPRHVYGFNNVKRGEQKIGPKVIEGYDRWAKNLTPELAVTNLFDRWLASWLWTFDVLPLLLSSIVVAGTAFALDSRGRLISLAIVSLHAIHIPYWYAGIMGWHYVFETAPLWCLLLGLATDLLFREWHHSGRWMMPGWWSLILLSSIMIDDLPVDILTGAKLPPSRIARGLGSIRYPRLRYSEFDRWLNAAVTNRPALVLIEVDRGDTHVDYITNNPGLDQPVLRARYLRDVTDLERVYREFSDRSIYLCQPQLKAIRLLKGKATSANENGT